MIGSGINPADRHQGLGQDRRIRAEPGPFAARQEDRLHRDGLRNPRISPPRRQGRQENAEEIRGRKRDKIFSPPLLPLCEFGVLAVKFFDSIQYPQS